MIEGISGPVIYKSGADHRLRLIKWGFPRRTQAMQSRGELAQSLGLIADLTNPMWEEVVQHPRYRRLIPISHFANPVARRGKGPAPGFQ